MEDPLISHINGATIVGATCSRITEHGWGDKRTTTFFCLSIKHRALTVTMPREIDSDSLWTQGTCPKQFISLSKPYFHTKNYRL